MLWLKYIYILPLEIKTGAPIVKFITVFAGVKAAVFLEEKISKSRGAAFTAKQKEKKRKKSQNQHEFVHMGLDLRTVQ